MKGIGYVTPNAEDASYYRDHTTVVPIYDAGRARMDLVQIG